MKILLINENYATKETAGGAETHFYTEVELLKNKGYDVATFTFGNFKRSKYNDYIYKENRFRLIRKVYKLAFNPIIYLRLRKIIKKLNPDIIHIHKNSKYPASVLLACRGRKVIHTVHDYGIICPTGWAVKKRDLQACECGVGLKCVKNKCVGILNYLFFQKPLYMMNNYLHKNIVKIFISPSNKLKGYLEKFKFKNVVMIHNPIDINKWEFSSVKKKDTIILSVGGLSKQKGVEYLIKAMVEIIRKIPSAELLIAGEGDERKNLQKLVKIIKMEDKIKFLGKVPNNKLRQFYIKSSVFVMPSIWMEQFGLVGAEALACGTPCVGSNRGGIPEWLIDNKHGYLAEPANPKDIAEKIIKLLDHPRLAKVFAANGRKFVEKELNQKKYLHALERLFEK